MAKKYVRSWLNSEMKQDLKIASAEMNKPIGDIKMDDLMNWNKKRAERKKLEFNYRF